MSEAPKVFDKTIDKALDKSLVKNLTKAKGPKYMKTEKTPSTLDKPTVSLTSLMEAMNKLKYWLRQNEIRMRRMRRRRRKTYKHVHGHRKS